MTWGQYCFGWCWGSGSPLWDAPAWWPTAHTNLHSLSEVGWSSEDAAVELATWFDQKPRLLLELFVLCGIIRVLLWRGELIKELQPDASQRAIAKTVGAGRATVQRDLGGPNGPHDPSKSLKTKGRKNETGPDGPPWLDKPGTEAAEKARKAAQRADWRFWFWPTYVCLPSALLAILARLPERMDWLGFGYAPLLFDPGLLNWQSLQELYFSLFLLFYLLSIWSRLVWSKTDGTGHASYPAHNGKDAHTVTSW